MGMKIKERSKGSTSKEGSDHSVGYALWSLGVPNTVKIFMWHTCNDLLPTKCNLFRRKIVRDNICPCYCREMESGLHPLWNCPTVQDVWRELNDLPEKCLLGGYFYAVGGVLFGSVKYPRYGFNGCALSQGLVEEKQAYF